MPSPAAAARSAIKNATLNYYPDDLSGQPFMKFSTFKMGGGVGSNIGDIHMTEVGGHVCLPIPSGVNSSYGQGWDQEEINPGISLGAEMAHASLGSYSPNSGTVSNTLAVVKSWSEPVNDTLGNTGAGGAAKAAGMLTVGKLIGNGGQSALQRATGAAAFFNTYATYGGPAFRVFQFLFSFKPLSYKDTQKVREILAFFKEGSFPKLVIGGVWRVYELPYVFKITYYDHNGAQHPHLPKISQSALTDLSVTYGGDKYTEFHEGSSPVQIDLSLSFREVALLSREDVGKGQY
jgi:hypothetical protein